MSGSPTPPPRTRPGAVVTGGGGGLGTAIGRELIALGHVVHLADVDLDAARRAAELLGDHAVATCLDVTDGGACRELARRIEASDGLAVWVNSAGLLRTGPSWTLPDAEVDELFAVNVHGTIHGTAAALEVMRPRDRGHVVNIVSLAGLVAPPGESMYAATKHAALAYTLGTAQDLRQHGIEGVRLSAVCPDGIWPSGCGPARGGRGREGVAGASRRARPVLPRKSGRPRGQAPHPKKPSAATRLPHERRSLETAGWLEGVPLGGPFQPPAPPSPRLWAAARAAGAGPCPLPAGRPGSVGGRCRLHRVGPVGKIARE